MRIMNVAKRFVTSMLICVMCCMCLCACGKYELKGHSFSNSNVGFTLSFGENLNATLITTNCDSGEETDTDLTYKVEDNNLFLYTDGLKVISATIEEDGKLIKITGNYGIDDISSWKGSRLWSSRLYREDAQDLQSSVESSYWQAVEDMEERLIKQAIENNTL